MQHRYRIKSDSKASNTISIISCSWFQSCPKKFLNLFNISIYLLSILLFNHQSILRASRRKKCPKKPINGNLSFWNRVFRKKPSSRVWVWSNTRRMLRSYTFSEYSTTFLSTQRWWGMCRRLSNKQMNNMCVFQRLKRNVQLEDVCVGADIRVNKTRLPLLQPLR